MGPWCGQMGIGGWVGAVGFWVIVVAVVIWGVSRLFPANDAPAPRAVLDARLASGDLTGGWSAGGDRVRDRQRDLEAAARSASGARDGDGAAVRLDQGLGDRQPDPGPAAGAVPSALCPVEALEHVRQVACLDPFPGVGDGEPDG